MTTNDLKLKVQTAVIQWWRMDDAGDGVEALVMAEFRGDTDSDTLSAWIEEQLTECKSIPNPQAGFVTQASAEHWGEKARQRLLALPDTFRVWIEQVEDRWYCFSEKL